MWTKNRIVEAKVKNWNKTTLNIMKRKKKARSKKNKIRRRHSYISNQRESGGVILRVNY